MIRIKNRNEVLLMKEGGQLLSKIMKKLKKEAVIGKTTIELDIMAERLVLDCGGTPSFKNYNGFPSTLCTSVNSEIVHGIPSKYALKDGDILSIDIGMFYKGFHTDMATTLPIGEVDPEILRFLKIAKKSLKRGIKKVHPGNTIGDLGNTIQRCVESAGFFIIDGLCGHGIGEELHEDPQVLNSGKRRSGPELKEGMVICIEPMISFKKTEIKKMPNGTFVTEDGSLSAHFEHTISITNNSYQILTDIS